MLRGSLGTRLMVTYLADASSSNLFFSSKSSDWVDSRAGMERERERWSLTDYTRRRPTTSHGGHLYFCLGQLVEGLSCGCMQVPGAQDMTVKSNVEQAKTITYLSFSW